MLATWLALGLIAGLACGGQLWAQQQSPKTPDQLWQEIETFQYLHALKLTAAQATQAAELLEPVSKLAAELEQRAQSPEVIEALEELRAAALAGNPITEEMYKKATTAKAKAAAEWSDEASPTLWSAAATAAEQIVALLQPEQVRSVARYEAMMQAETVITGAMGQAEEDDEGWQQWVEDTIAELGTTNALPEGAAEKISQFLARVRGLSVEAAEEQKAALTEELVGLIVSGDSDEDLKALAVELLSDQIVNNRSLQSCLREYAAAVAG